MTTTDIYSDTPSRRSGYPAGEWLLRGQAWLDDKGKGAWIAAMVAGFIVFWPVGLGLLAYMIWSKRMFAKSRSGRGARSSVHSAMRSSGNTAFDAYKTETLRRLEDEQQSFEAFLGRLREAKDKAEFDQFMNDRSTRPARKDEDDTPAPA